MAEDVILYTHPMSRGRIARWMLEEVGCTYRAEILGYGDVQVGDYREINPMGKVPAIRHGEVVVTETSAICLYLADAFPKAGLAPAIGRPERGSYYRWIAFAAGPVEAALTNRALGVQLSPEQTRFVGYGDYERVIDTLDAFLSRSDYVTGPAFTAADLYLGAQVIWGLRFGTIDSRRAFEAYRERLFHRPAFVRARQIDDELLARQNAS